MQIGYGSTEGAKERLLRANGCLGCHATTGSGWTGVGGAPIVYNTSAPTYGDSHPDLKHVGLAAGNFYWTTEASASGQSRGHSLSGIQYADDTSPSGYDPRGSCGAGCHVPTGLQTQGCKACHLPAHHKGGSSGGWAAADAGYYRFLGPLTSASAEHQWGVRGYEDPVGENTGWQKNASQTVHNEYSGEGKQTGVDGYNYFSISTYCLGCHDSGDYPDLCASDVWYHEAVTVLLDRIADTRWDGYRGYAVGDNPPGPYSPMLPIARLYITNYTSPSELVLTPSSGGTNRLMCLTCHRAHASPYNKMLRWDNSLAWGDLPSESCKGCHKPY